MRHALPKHEVTDTERLEENALAFIDAFRRRDIARMRTAAALTSPHGKY
jgi:hypothetical protein